MSTKRQNNDRRTYFGFALLVIAALTIVGCAEMDLGTGDGASTEQKVERLQAPAFVTASVIYDDVVRVGWAGVDGATTYEMSIDDGPWFDVGHTVEFHDYAAPAGELVSAGEARASDGDSVCYIGLELADVVTNPGESVQYRVRAVGFDGPGYPKAASGRRAAPSVTVQWQRSLGPYDDVFAPIEGGDTIAFDDFGVPLNGELRYYRCQVTTDFGDEMFSTVDSGHVARQHLVTKGVDDSDERAPFDGEAAADEWDYELTELTCLLIEAEMANVDEVDLNPSPEVIIIPGR